MHQLLDALRPRYEFIIMDSPPAGFVSDTLSLLLNAPQSIIIARQNHAVYNEVAKTVELIKGVGGQVLGAILTDVKEQHKSYGYTYHAYRYRGDRYHSHYSRSDSGYGYGYGYAGSRKKQGGQWESEGTDEREKS